MKWPRTVRQTSSDSTNPINKTTVTLQQQFTELQEKYTELEKKLDIVLEEKKGPTISSTQVTVLYSILNLITYEVLFKEAFEAAGRVVPNPIPFIHGLSYKEATMIIEYGHEKFRLR